MAGQEEVAGQLAVKLSHRRMSSNKRLISELEAAKSCREEAVAAHKFAESRTELRNLHAAVGIWTVARNKEKLMGWRRKAKERRVQDAGSAPVASESSRPESSASKYAGERW